MNLVQVFIALCILPSPEITPLKQSHTEVL